MIFYLQEDYTKAIRGQIRELEEYLGQGKAESYERYKELTGKVAGLKKALELFNDVAKRHGEIDEDD